MNPIVYFYKTNQLWIITIIVFILLDIVYTYGTYFSKTITIKEKDYLKNGKYGENVVSDMEGNIYSISNSIHYWFFTATELYTELTEKQTYNVTGYGYRIPILNMFPTIISATKV